MIVPTGSPAWVHANNHETYGGNVNKENYQALDSINGRTDVSAQEFVRGAADLAAMQRTASFCTLVYRCFDTIPGAPRVESYLAMAGSTPTPARVSNGRVTWTWLASYSDPYSQTGLLHIVGCTYAVEGIGGRNAGYVLSDPDINGYNERVEVAAFDDAGVALVDPVVTLTVYTGQV
jgi:hypothetical protein